MIVGLAAGTLTILATFLILSAAFAGIGLLVRQAFGCKAIDIDDGFLAFWTGYGVVILILILWNFFLPVGLSALGFVLTLGGIGILLTRRALTNMFRSDQWRPTFLQALPLIVGALWVANQSMAGLRSWDGGLYHLQAVQWATTYPIVPGIANLHGPLAFNNSSLLYDAMLDSGWWKGRAFHVANGTLVFVMGLQAIVAGARLASGTRWATDTRLYRFLLLAPTVYLTIDGNLASYSTDIPATLILLVATATMYDLLGAGAAHPSTTGDAYSLVALAILLATAVCIKMSAGVFAAMAMPVAVVFWWKRGSRSESHSTSTLVWVALVILAFAIPWMARGVVMSGYPFFPLPVAGFPVDWRAPVEHAWAELAYIGFTEREFTWRIFGGNWLRLVFLHDIFSVLIPTCLAASAMLVLVFSKKIRNQGREACRDTWWLLLPVTVAIGAWLLSAPSTRYSPALFWTLTGVCVCECRRALWPNLGRLARRCAVLGAVLLGVSPSVLVPARGAIRHGDNPVAVFLTSNIIMPGPDRWFHPISEQAEVTTYTTLSGLTLNVPKKPRGSETFAKPWKAPIPCTPNPAPNLRLRQPPRLEKGFSVEGGWQMQDWPYYWQPSFLPEWRMRRASAGAS